MKEVERVIGHRIQEIREKVIAWPDASPDGLGFVILESGDVAELISHSPWAPALKLKVFPESERDWKDGTFVSQHSRNCQGLTVIDIFRSEYVSTIGLVLSDQTAIYMDSDFGDDRLSLFHKPLGEPFITDARSWISGNLLSPK